MGISTGLVLLALTVVASANTPPVGVAWKSNPPSRWAREGGVTSKSLFTIFLGLAP